MSRWLLFGLLTVPFGAPAQGAEDDGETLFETRIRPVLSETCFKCHGGEKTSHDLRVDSREAILRGGKSGAAIVPGDPDKSLLIKAIRRGDDADYPMPPDKALTRETVADFEKWVKLGAPWPKDRPGQAPFAHQAHWAFQPVKRFALPLEMNMPTESGIDCFIAKSQREQGLPSTARAERHVLLRRLYFDLVGLPPMPEEAAEFLADESPDAWPRLIDRLLASPRYGERWGRYWMDVVRYADTAGDNADYPVPEARLYRDYIIAAFNADLPYDQFVREQLAGDILAEQGPEAGISREEFARQTMATGFLALSRRYATGPYELWHLTLEDAIDTTGRAFLGLTFKCARCHDHKFDPLTQQDYYALYGIFASTQFPWAGGEEFASKQFGRKDFIPLLPPAQAASAWKEHREKVAMLEAELKRLENDNKTKAEERKIADDVLKLLHGRDVKDPIAALKAELRDRARTSVPSGVPCAYGVRDGSPADVPLQPKGEPNQPGPIIPRGAPQFLAKQIGNFEVPAGQSGRLQLAQWLTRSEHPLVPRVLVNRIWQLHFGKGIVGTSSNFGLRGELPTHPELLDYLAAEFVTSGWSIKKLHRTILSSNTWRLSSTVQGPSSKVQGQTKGGPALGPGTLDIGPFLQNDPDNRYYARFDRRRLDAEAIRDALHSVSGTLDLHRPGEHPFPPITTWGWTQHTPFKDVYPSNHRSVYLMTQRLQKHPFLALFDGPDTNTTTEKRTSSTVPLQALYWMNSPQVREQAEAFAARLIAAHGEPRERIRFAYELAYSRQPTADELAHCLAYLQEYSRKLHESGLAAAEVERENWSSLARILLSANEFLYID